MLERYADNDGVRIRYLDNDPASPVGLPVLFVPGISDFADDYVEALACFGDRRLLVVELRGRGGSDAPATGYSAGELAGDALAVLDDSGVGDLHVMTFSRGTTPALELAFRLAGRVKSVAIGDYLPAEIGLPPDFADTMLATRWRGRPTSERVSRSTLEALGAISRTRDLLPDLAALGVPTLVARGTEPGAILDDDRVERYRAGLPGVEIVTIAGSGHDLFRPSRTAYPEAVLSFIARRVPGC